MKSLDFIFVGQAKNGAYKSLEEFYLERITHYVKSAKIHVVKDSSEKNVAVRKEKETQDILSRVEAKDVVVVCDEKGKAMDSVAFSKKLDAWCGMGQRVIFVVGGAYGMNEDIRSKSQFCLKLCEWTLPHELARVVVMEQVYRAFSILKGEKYHHA